MAERDIVEITQWSLEHFGERAAERYESLLTQVLLDLADNPLRLGSKRRDEIHKGIYTYHFAFSRDHVRGERVKAPRHLVMYRIRDGSVDVLRLLHDSRDLVRHLPRD